MAKELRSHKPLDAVKKKRKKKKKKKKQKKKVLLFLSVHKIIQFPS